MQQYAKYREIPYNYTSFSDKEIILKYFDSEIWSQLNALRKERVTGRSAKLLFEIVGDIFIIDRNPYIFNDFLENPAKQFRLKKVHKRKLDIIQSGASNPLVSNIVNRVRSVGSEFFSRFKKEIHWRKEIIGAMASVTAKENIQFSAFHKVLHVTDATDWRVEYPQVVCYPQDATEICRIVKQAKRLGLKLIARGGGTGLTGGAIPVYPNTMVLNTEKLNRVGSIETICDNGISIPTVHVEAGVITDAVSRYCDSKGYIFATDPTSAWASTIGGNIAENCGGKKAVIWGTAIDNLYSFDMVNGDGEILQVKRRNHPYRKILDDDSVVFDVFNTSRNWNAPISTISLKGTDIRKKGVGKDITNKALGGLPGVQKEGGDGIIVSAKFVLYKPFSQTHTICLEFFGSNLINASKAIVAVRELFDANENVFLTALEHFDDKYVQAINYRNKSNRSELPKAVVIIDVESNDFEALEMSCSSMVELVTSYNCEGFIASNKDTQQQFWQDRKNLGAIAKHTNAFKLNEDVVIPIESLPDFAAFIEKINIQKELSNFEYTVDQIVDALSQLSQLDSFALEKRERMIALLMEKKRQSSVYLASLDADADGLAFTQGIDVPIGAKVFELIRDGVLSRDFHSTLIESVDIFHGYDDVLKRLRSLIDTGMGRKIIIATHMHAGDGNIHVNIPVHSSDYAMMQEADETAGIIMEKTKALGGVISGEHGIGLTKLRFIDGSILEEYKQYKSTADPDDIFNPGKLREDFPLSSIYTPSLNLLKMEAFILEAADLDRLTGSISACVRCGKCKENCNTQYPEGNIHFCPRNKILGVSLITEAVLYEAQTAKHLSFRNFKMLREIAGYCTMCHNCYAPCPVNIDFGDVTLYTRELLANRRRSRIKVLTAMTLFYLRRRNYAVNKLFRIGLLKFGYGGQRLAHYVHRPIKKLMSRVWPFMHYMLSGQFPRAGNRTFREIFGLNNSDMFYVFQHPKREVTKSVLYFPGCGSERMFSDISLAALALLYNKGIRIVVPPDYLCCGYPMLANGKVKAAQNRSYENRVVFHRISATASYMNIEDILVTCGTCYEMLDKYNLETVFPNSKVVDVNEFAIQESLISVEGNESHLFYHEPCHSPLKQFGYERVISSLIGGRPISIPNCCGEGGTLALSTPDISYGLRQRKIKNMEERTGKGPTDVITTCPSCVQGISKIQPSLKIKGKSLIVEVADMHLGKNWKRKFIRHVKKASAIERVLF